MSIEEIIRQLEGFRKMSEGISKIVESPERKAHYEARVEALEGAIALLKTYPKADVQPVRHGRWDKAGYDLARCSLCHTVRKTDFARDHYCPNCGAKMDGEEAAADEQKS